MKPIAIVALLALTCIACGKSKEQQPAENLQKSADQIQKGAEDLARGLGDLANGISAAGDANAKPLDPVSFKDLQTLLPELLGWQREKPTGERLTAPMSFSDASVRLTNGEAVITIKITDSALNQAFVAPFAIFLAGNYERDTNNGYEKSIKIGDAPGFEKWDGETKSGNLTVIVNKRFVVEVDGSGIPDPKVLHLALDKTELKKLAAMK